MPDFLLEIGCEEIPARMIGAASQEMRDRLQTLLERERLAPSGVISQLESPRRLAILAQGIPPSQADVTEQVTGPSAQVAFKDGQPAPAAHAFAKKVGIDEAIAARMSPSRLKPTSKAPLLLVVGERESRDGFHWQTDELIYRWQDAGPRLERLTLAGADHFTVLEGYADRSSPLYRRLLALATA